MRFHETVLLDVPDALKLQMTSVPPSFGCAYPVFVILKKSVRSTGGISWAAVRRADGFLRNDKRGGAKV